jgi:hypothetical protein
VYASKTLIEHLVRGAIGVGALIFGLYVASTQLWLAMLTLPVAIVAFRGCPTCWIVGLGQTIAARAQGKSAPDACIDGSCARGRVSDAADPRRGCT